MVGLRNGIFQSYRNEWERIFIAYSTHLYKKVGMNSSKTGLASSPMLLNTYIEDITTESFDGTIRLVNRLILGENKKKVYKTILED